MCRYEISSDIGWDFWGRLSPVGKQISCLPLIKLPGAFKVGRSVSPSHVFSVNTQFLVIKIRPHWKANPSVPMRWKASFSLATLSTSPSLSEMQTPSSMEQIWRGGYQRAPWHIQEGVWCSHGPAAVLVAKSQGSNGPGLLAAQERECGSHLTSVEWGISIFAFFFCSDLQGRTWQVPQSFATSCLGMHWSPTGDVHAL